MKFKNLSKKHLWFIIPAAVLVIGLTTFRLVLPSIVKHKILSKIEAVEKEKRVRIPVGDLRVVRCNLFGKIALEMSDVHLVADSCRDEFLSLDRLHTEVRAWRGLHLVKEVQELDVDHVKMNVVKRGDYTNYGFLHQHSVSDGKRDYCARFTKLLEALNGFCPDQLTVKRLDIETSIDSVVNDYDMADLVIEGGKVSGLVTVLPEQPQQSQWRLQGTIDKAAKSYAGEIVLTDSDSVAAIPIGESIEKSNVQFRKAAFRMNVKEQKSKLVTLSLSGDIEKLQFFHRYIAEHPVCINNTGAALDIRITPNKLQVDSTSTLTLNQAEIHPFFSYEKNEKRHIVLKVDERKCNAQKLFASLPEGLFVVLPQMEVRGNLDLKLLFDCDFAHLDQLKFDFDIRSADHSFEIVKGMELITQFNEPFVYKFFEAGNEALGIEDTEIDVLIDSVGNPLFCPFSQIPAALTNSILISEDPSFFHHRGFLKDAIRNAMVADLQAGRLVRGGSTISMQLVKNLFLNRKKVFTRKIEELLLVWMIEDRHLISKQRMFEIYVNIVEWAPEVIGLGAASQFYFAKTPAELTMGECLYLATLIRSPKHYRSTLDASGRPSGARQDEMRFAAKRMQEREWMSASEYENLNTGIQIVAPQESVADSLAN